MKKMTVGEFKTHFSEVIEQVRSGERIAVTFGKKKEVIGYFYLKSPNRKSNGNWAYLKEKHLLIFTRISK
jgi:hypothetical protein